MDEHSATRSVCVTNLRGLHARPAELIAKRAMEFKSKIEIIRDGHRVDAKSILHILTLGAECGTELILEAQGTDAERAIDALAELIGGDFAAFYQNNQI
ncbi:MAG: HPr family phosphocarrier protein [Pirellulales bacterium]|nr:HPr family phosphocarrier protein [Pirellulales bacterium]